MSLFNLTLFLTLHENCPYFEFFWFVFSYIWTEYEEILRICLYSVLMRENTNQKTFVFGHSSRSESIFYLHHPPQEIS